MKKAVIFAPFWRQPGHVGNNRVDRFVRWLAEDGFHVIMIRAGSADGARNETWGMEITVCDPMGLYRDASPTGMQPPARRPNKLRRALSYWLFNPDPGVLWARVAARHPLVLGAAEGGAFILSSSPPESAHVGAWKLSRRLRIPLIVDMRDGWLDEPLKPLLRSSAFRRWQEARLEAQVLHHASAIQVTSAVWQELLCTRKPQFADKVIVLTNCYPPGTPVVPWAQSEQKVGQVVLVHAGRFSGSDTRRTPDILLQPLLEEVSRNASVGTIKFIGPLNPDELTIIERYAASFAARGWRIECPGSLPRHELLQLLPQADGLLLLSASYAAIPSKLFEYIPTGRPILVVTERGSATWRICEKLPQAVLIESNTEYDGGRVVRFLERAAVCDGSDSVVFNEFTEDKAKSIFLPAVKRSCKKTS